jgi:hypothetical protein
MPTATIAHNMVDPTDWVGKAVQQSACFGISGMRKRDGRRKGAHEPSSPLALVRAPI